MSNEGEIPRQESGNQIEEALHAYFKFCSPLLLIFWYHERLPDFLDGMAKAFRATDQKPAKREE